MNHCVSILSQLLRFNRRQPAIRISITAVAIFAAIALIEVVAPYGRMEAFQLGSDEIDEGEILHRIEEEIVTPKKHNKDATTGGRPGRTGHWLTIQQQSNIETLEGLVRLNQDSVTIGEVDRRREVPLLLVRRLHIIKWRPHCLRQTAAQSFDVLMIPDHVVLTLTNNDTIEGSIDGENWMQLTLDSLRERHTISLSFTASVEADSESEAMQKAVNQEPESSLYSLLSFQTKPSPSRENRSNENQATSQR